MCRPLNTPLLSDEVIGHVKRRGRSLHRSIEVECRFPIDDHFLHPEITLDKCDRGFGGETVSSATTTSDSRSQNASLISVPTSITKTSPLAQRRYSGSKRQGEEDIENVPCIDKQRIQSSLDYHRDRCRRNQQRYRLRQRKRLETLQNDMKCLHDEVQSLQEHRDKLGYVTQTDETVWAVAAEYFRVFRFGFLAGDHAAEEKLNHLNAVMAPGMDVGTVRGFAALAKNWAVFSQYFQNVSVQLQKLEQPIESLLVATTTTSITLSKNSLSHFFPHLYSSGVGGTKQRCTRVGAKLLGQRLVMRGSVRFHWDTSKNRVVGLYSQANMVTPLLELLGNLEDVARVFAHGLITPDCNLVVNTDSSKRVAS